MDHHIVKKSQKKKKNPKRKKIGVLGLVVFFPRT